jgi:hypothetical protein
VCVDLPSFPPFCPLTLLRYRRIATEIKLFKPLSRATYDFYRSVTPLGDDGFDALAETQAWTWKLVFVTDIAYVPHFCPIFLSFALTDVLEQPLRFDRSNGEHSSSLCWNNGIASPENTRSGGSKLQRRRPHPSQPYLRPSLPSFS